MPNYGGFIYVIDEPQRAQDLLDALGDYKNDFTDVLSASDFEPKRSEIFLVSLDGKSVEIASLVRKSGRVAFKKDRVRFTNIVRFERLPFDEIEQAIEGKLKSHFGRSSTGVTSRVPPRTWEGVLS